MGSVVVHEDLKVLDVSKIKEAKVNARLHGDAQLEKLKQSITEFGFTNPILVDGRNTIIAGHGRLSAAKSLGMEGVPAIRVLGLSDNQKRALALADNRIPLDASWDLEILNDELDKLIDSGLNVEVAGFSPEEIDSIISQSMDAVDQTIEVDDRDFDPNAIRRQLEQYEDREIRQIKLLYSTEEFEPLVKKMEELRQGWELENFSEVVAKLVNNA